jgi:cobalt-zinc-cadmium efflux system membrane fusion protein
MDTHMTDSENARLEPPRQRRYSGVALAAVLIAGLVGGALLMRGMRGTGPADRPAVEVPKNPAPPSGAIEITEVAQRNAGVQIAPAETAVLPTTIEVTGAVAPDERQLAHIRPIARGLIEDVTVSLGSRVQAGEPLLTLDNIELGELIGTYLSEKAALQQTQTDLEVRRQSLDRAEELIKLEAIAQQTLDLRRAEFRNAEAAVTSQRARVSKVEEQIHRFGLSDPDLAKLTPEEGQSGHRTSSHNALRAPISGVITKYDVAKGEVVQPDHELFTIANLASVWVLADVYEKDLGKIQRDADVSVRVEAYPERVFPGKLTYVSDLIDPKTRTAKVRCVVANADSVLKLDMFARISIPTRDRRSAVLVPAAAVQQVAGQSVVFVRQSPTQFVRRDVRLGGSAGDRIEVLSGLRAGEPIVGAGSFYFKTALLRGQIGEQ